MKKNVKLVEIKKSDITGKKWTAIFLTDGKIIKTHFGAEKMSDFTIHNDIDRRNRYIKRHWKDLRTRDPTRAGYLSMYILWNKRGFNSSVKDYKNRLKIYNMTGKFPIEISGYNSRESSFGIRNNSVTKNDNVEDIKLYNSIKLKIQKKVKSAGRRWGAYDSGLLVKKYISEGGKYKNKGSGKLKRWYDEKWIDACAWPDKIKPCGRNDASKGKITYCRPLIRIDKNTPKTVKEIDKKIINTRCKIKRDNPKIIIR